MDFLGKKLIPLFAALLFLVASCAFAAGVIASVGVKKIAATQTEVGQTAVTKMMLYWVSESKGTPEGFRKYLAEKVLSDPFPGVSGPSLWGENFSRTYILDGHHRALAIQRILYQDYDTLPEQLKYVMSKEMQATLRASPAMKIRVQIAESFGTVNELLKKFATSNEGQLPRAVREQPAFAREIAKLRAGSANVDFRILAEGYANMAASLSDLKDNPLRSAVGNAFRESGINSAKMANYVEFATGEQIENSLPARGVKVTDENAVSPEITAEVRRAIFEDKKVMRFLREASREGKESENKAMLDKARAKYIAERASLPGASCGELFKAEVR